MLVIIKNEGVSVLSIDPGRKMGWAAWYSRSLVGCGVATTKKKDIGEAAKELADLIPQRPQITIVEEMVHYPGKSRTQGTQEALANDLIQVTAFGALVAGLIGSEVVRYIPAQKWKGTRPTEGVVDRAVEKALASEELEVYHKSLGELPKGIRHNLVDAVGIGLKVHGRFR